MLLILKVEQAHEGFLFSPIEEKFKVSGGGDRKNCPIESSNSSTWILL